MLPREKGFNFYIYIYKDNLIDVKIFIMNK